MQLIQFFGFGCILFFISGCTDAQLKQSELVGSWKCISVNGIAIENTDFVSVDLIFYTTGQIEQKAIIGKYGGSISMSADGEWKLFNDSLIVNVNGREQECGIRDSSTILTFTPDPIFIDGIVSNTTYVKVP